MKLSRSFVILCIILSIEGWDSIKGGNISPLDSITIIDTLENFDEGTISLSSWSNEDLQPNMWQLNSITTYNNSPFSLKLYGNTWKFEIIDSLNIDSGDVWQVSAYIEQVAEIQGFGLTDSINTLLYSFAGSEEVDPNEWITVYQGAFPIHSWNNYQLPVADDWFAKFGYLPTIKGVIYINDRDFSSNGISYFDEILDITNDLPIAPGVEIYYDIGDIYKNENGIRSVDVHFTSKVYDPDSEIHEYFWDFGDDSTSTLQNPFHTFLVEDDHEYTVLLMVTDETNKSGSASCQISVDPGPTSFPITMNFVGDIILARGIENYINLNGYEPIFNPTLPFLGDAADITVANLECPLTDQGTPHPTKLVVFRSAPQNVAALSYAGIDIVTLANNHIIDYGLEGLQQTQSVLEEENINYFGAGADSYEALQPAFYLKDGVNFAFLGQSDRTGQYNNHQPFLNAGFNKPGFANLTKYNISQQIDQVKDVADFIIFEFHSGSEYSTAPSEIFSDINLLEDPKQDEDFSTALRSPQESDIEIRHYAIDQGADAVICHHPHILHGFEVYKEKLIAHSLGNFIFDLTYPETFPTVILNSKINSYGFYEYSIVPIYICDNIPVRAEGEFGLYLLNDVARRSKDLNTYIVVDREKITASIILDTMALKPKYNIATEELILTDTNGVSTSQPILLKRNGCISSIKEITPGGNWEYRLGRQIIWFGNFEDEGCNLWEINHPDEFFDTTESYSGQRSLCQVRTPGLSSLNTNLKLRLKLYSDSSQYTLHSYLKTENASNAGVTVQFYESLYQTNPVGNEDLGVQITGTNDWNFYHNEFSPPINGNYINIRLRSESPQSDTGFSWFDNTGLIEWSDWKVFDPAHSIDEPNDFYWLQLRTNNIVAQATVSYIETKYNDGIITRNEDEGIFVPRDFTLFQNFPNPFNSSATIQYDIPAQTNVILKIYNILGQEIKTLVNEFQPPGKRQCRWNGKDNSGHTVSSGIYIYCMQTSYGIKSKKMVLIK